jgi:hypothetical protein
VIRTKREKIKCTLTRKVTVPRGDDGQLRIKIIEFANILPGLKTTSFKEKLKENSNFQEKYQSELMTRGWIRVLIGWPVVQHQMRSRKSCMQTATRQPTDRFGHL